MLHLTIFSGGGTSQGAQGNKLVGVWIMLAGTVLTVIISLAVGRGVVHRRRRRQNLSMRDHLSRISRPYEEHNH